MKTKTLIRRILDIILSLLLIAVLVFTIRVMVLTSKGKTVPVFGKCVLKVVTGSMEPSIHVGEFILVDETAKEYAVNDIISFYSEDPEIKGMLVTHRIVGINPDGSYKTKGDAADTADIYPVKASQIEGKFVKKLRFYKWIGSFADRKKLLFLLVILPMFFIAVYEVKTLAETWRKVLNDREEKGETATGKSGETREEMIERLKREAVEEFLARSRASETEESLTEQNTTSITEETAENGQEEQKTE